MKKIIIVAAVIFTTGILSLYTRDSNVKPSFTMVQRSVFDLKKELGSGD